jgi:hypothetical protein
MKQIKTLRFYDFDGTLFFNMLPDDGKPKWEDIYGIKYPHIGWWSKPESLDLNLGVYPNSHVINHYRELLNSSCRHETKHMLLTARLPKLSEHIKNILDTENLIFDDYHYIDNKISRVKKILSLDEYKNVNSIFLYDDREKELLTFRNFREEMKGLIDVTVYEITPEGLITLG